MSDKNDFDFDDDFFKDDNDEFDFGFGIDWMRKDLGLAMDEGRGIGVSLPITALVNQFFAEVQALGGGRQDTSALIRRLPRRSGS